MLLDIDYHPCQGQVAQSDAYQTCLLSSPLNHWVQSFWQLDVPAGKYSYRSVPDNSVDLIINLDFPEDIFIVTPFSSSLVFEMQGPVSYFGIRFRILGHQGLISMPLGEWSGFDDSKIADLLPDHVLYSLYECIEKSLHFDARCKHLTSLLLGYVKYSDIDPRLARYVRFCYQNKSSSISLSDKQCAEFGVSSRHLRRLSQLYLGLLPREFTRVMRFQHVLRLMVTESNKTVWADHYYDQPHFIREFKRLSGLTPAEFKSLSVLYNKNPD